MTKTLKIEEDGDDLIISIPDEILQEVGWKENDVLEWVTSDDGIILKKAEDESI